MKHKFDSPRALSFPSPGFSASSNRLLLQALVPASPLQEQLLESLNALLVDRARGTNKSSGMSKRFKKIRIKKGNTDFLNFFKGTCF